MPRMNDGEWKQMVWFIVGCNPGNPDKEIPKNDVENAKTLT